MSILIKIWSVIVLVVGKIWAELTKEPANNVLDTDAPADEPASEEPVQPAPEATVDNTEEPKQ
ncbi:hypothetical protein pEaSNUABM50_00503 [Erwinia phage pEa_SNUABM_50]|uniref:Uncharacterized protein n=3 Tax=Eneladusvirus BF TaxID=2560751 RepID=A0A7L8ZQF0_9CAUD|nr:hypothetical protein FDH34_gp439 [Serratia phage BF]QOI71465.1 hypothetical protein pEaSNUABM12_00553 [Erwinia phage pEa_SNUABM_12]QOI72498.1 hypothetical protein pEaSNUABM50_00503 [Erwinia phage pEa_SNUABM_50]QXO11626.1 hypothetical protein pEaSNUABM19_00510 [Erwinia phage pEa_SNUABM_19]QXO12174.1 hypothetical protein pEaSNUABM44_00508 [Erwinia phage pEa_SNUABM_44]QXO12730.1 hypothetical protein pEaSNUABM49_00512 [Erwinia phage pEa_SNUABM_49]